MRCFFRSMTPTNATPPTAIIDQGEGSGTGAPMVMSFTLALDPKGSTSILSTSPKHGLVRAKMFTLAGTGGGPALPLPPTAVGLKLWVANQRPAKEPFDGHRDAGAILQIGKANAVQTELRRRAAHLVHKARVGRTQGLDILPR